MQNITTTCSSWYSQLNILCTPLEPVVKVEKLTGRITPGTALLLLTTKRLPSHLFTNLSKNRHPGADGRLHTHWITVNQSYSRLIMVVLCGEPYQDCRVRSMPSMDRVENSLYHGTWTNKYPRPNLKSAMSSNLRGKRPEALCSEKAKPNRCTRHALRRDSFPGHSWRLTFLTWRVYYICRCQLS